MIPELWTAYEAAAATGGMLCARGAGVPNDSDLPEESWTAKGISIDTRTIKPGEIFVALKDVRDGHDFVRNAFKAGASAALVSRAPNDTPDGAPLLVVEDTLNGLEALAAAARDRCFGKLIGVTGSAGKTSTKEMLRTALASSGKVHAAERSFNNHLGVPLTLAELPSDAEFGVFEIGMNHAGEITPLSRLVRPHVAIITTVAAAHLENFGSIAGIAKAKAEIFAGVRRNGAVILPRDNDHFDILQEHIARNNPCGSSIRQVTFGRHETADIRLLAYEQTADGMASARIDLFGVLRDMQLGVAGEHQAMNALAVLAAVRETGGDIDHAFEALATARPVEGRGLPQMLTVSDGEATIVDESYNANPASMAAAINVLAKMPANGQRIVLLGEMRELGDTSAQLHLGLAELLVDAKIDKVHAAGGLMKPMLAKLPEQMRGEWAEEAVDLTDIVYAGLKAGDVLMAKGSNASKVSAFVTKLLEKASG